MDDEPLPTYVVALTGGIASGKTTVADLFSALGVPVVDTDRLAHELVEPGQPLLEEIAALFGRALIDDRGRLQRRELRRIVFADAGKRKQLEALLHPAIRHAALNRIRQVDTAYCLVVIPLLAESGRHAWIDRVLVVDVDPQVQIERVMQRDGVSRDEALAVLAAQASREQRLAIADDVIDNSGGLGDLGPQIAALHAKYLSIATL